MARKIQTALKELRQCLTEKPEGWIGRSTHLEVELQDQHGWSFKRIDHWVKKWEYEENRDAQ